MADSSDKDETMPSTSHDHSGSSDEKDTAVDRPIDGLRTTNEEERLEAPITFKTYVLCAFASCGGLFFGYDSGYINGYVLALTSAP